MTGLYNTSSTLLVRDRNRRIGSVRGGPRTRRDGVVVACEEAQIGAGLAHLFPPARSSNRTTPGPSYTAPYLFVTFIF
jgi:hypothetical protein